MKSCLQKNITQQHEVELIQDLFWLFVDERLKTLQQSHETFETFLELLDQLIESEKKRTPTRKKSVVFAIKEEIFLFDFTKPPNHPPLPEHFIPTHLHHSRSLDSELYQ